MSLAQEIQNQDRVQVLTLRLAEENFCLPALCVREIEKNIETTQLPESPSHVTGVFDWRGEAIPMINLAERLGIPNHRRDAAAPFAVIVSNDQDQHIALATPNMPAMRHLDTKQIESPPANMGDVDQTYIEAVGKEDGDIFFLLDMKRLLSGV